MKYIIAGSYNEYKHYVESHKGNFTFLTDVSQIESKKTKPEFILVGKFYNNTLITENRLKAYGL